MKVNQSRWLPALKWLGTGFTILGALLTALGGHDPVNVWAFNIGALGWLLAAALMRDSALITVNAVLLTIYAIGAILRIS